MTTTTTTTTTTTIVVARERAIGERVAAISAFGRLNLHSRTTRAAASTTTSNKRAIALNELQPHWRAEAANVLRAHSGSISTGDDDLDCSRARSLVAADFVCNCEFYGSARNVQINAKTRTHKMTAEAPPSALLVV